MGKKILVRYLRNKKTGRRNGVVVATGKGKVGWSLLREKSDSNSLFIAPFDVWNRELGMSIAIGRANTNVDWEKELVNRYGENHAPRIWKELFPAIREMEDRAERYFKDEPVTA